MCNCKIKKLSQEIGNQQMDLVQLPSFMRRYFANKGLYKHHIWIDSCLLDEIKYLWDNGIVTTGCCCGHNLLPPYIGVDIRSSDDMKLLGYKVQYNPFDNKRDTSFYPKSVKTSLKFRIKNYFLRVFNIIDTDSLLFGITDKL